MTPAERLGRKVRRWLDVLASRRRRSLVSVRGETRVTVTGVIAGGVPVRSPVSGVEAAVLSTALISGRFERRRRHEANMINAALDHVDPIFEKIYEVVTVVDRHHQVLVDTPDGRVVIPEGPLRLSYAMPFDRDPTPIDRVPQALRAAYATIPPDREVAYTDRFLATGDAVRLTASVRAVPKASGPYRGRAVPPGDFVVTPRECPWLEELVSTF
ncbi:MAG: hypothetical protein AAGN82_05740 [Myxococcota bacterium]